MFPSTRTGIGIGLLAAAVSAYGSTVKATYLFNNSLNSQESGSPALVLTDPEHVAAYSTDTIYGQSRTVLSYGGSASPAQQGGLTFDDSGLLVPLNSYSVEMVFEFFDRDGDWRRIIDVANRQSDFGFYVNPGNHLDIFNAANGSNTFTNNAYHYIVLTDNAGSVSVYLDGTQDIVFNTNLMDISNPGDLVNFFLDNTVGNGQGEWSSGRVALIRLSDGILSASDVSTLASDPFPTSTVPEPSTLLLLLTACAAGHRRLWPAGRAPARPSTPPAAPSSDPPMPPAAPAPN